MTPAEVLDQAQAAGVTLWAEGEVLRYRGPREALAKLLPEAKAHKTGILAALAQPNLSRLSAEDLVTPIYIEKGLPGVSPEFAARLSPEDLADIAAGDIPVEQVQAFEQAAIAREAEDLIVILEHDAGLSRAEAEFEAVKST